MARGERKVSNLIEEWNDSNKIDPERLEDQLTPERYRALFDTLVDWNDYLDNHAPDIKELLL
ncbi:hypothetical protein AB835_05920 [Candidatus Endobugula sertula]|uniref:Uncharacterized protein n=1 Tax=Candidatus Endobugula sertula TaxID=62101 RepID=A0A1D2QR47_9GAMM|nr:hypothetical protein AB835_05920 [Candidatus Endobugula sertula]